MNEEDFKLIKQITDWLGVSPDLCEYEDLEMARANLLRLRVRLYKDLVLKREQYRMPNYKPDPKDKDTPRYTDLDRRTMLEAAAADPQAEYELVSGLEKLVKERIELIKQLLEK